MPPIVAKPSAEYVAEQKKKQSDERRAQIAALRKKPGRAVNDNNQMLDLIVDELLASD